MTPGRRITVADIYAYAVTPLRLGYLFWGTEEPYFTAEVRPFLRTLRQR